MYKIVKLSIEEVHSYTSSFQLNDEDPDRQKRIFVHGVDHMYQENTRMRLLCDNILLQNTVCRILTEQITQTIIYLPLSSDKNIEALGSCFHLTRLAQNDIVQKLRLYDMQLIILFSFFDAVRKGVIHPLFTESCKTYAEKGPVAPRVKYLLFEDDNPPEPDISDPLVRYVYQLPKGAPVDINVYLPFDKAVGHPIIRQITSLCGSAVFFVSEQDGKKYAAGLIGDRA